jgi:hypothetical protein
MTEKELIEKMLFEAKQDKPVPSPTSMPSMGERIRGVVSKAIKGIVGGMTSVPPSDMPEAGSFHGSIPTPPQPKPGIKFKDIPQPKPGIKFKDIPPET